MPEQKSNAVVSRLWGKIRIQHHGWCFKGGEPLYPCAAKQTVGRSLEREKNQHYKYFSKILGSKIQGTPTQGITHGTDTDPSAQPQDLILVLWRFFLHLKKIWNLEIILLYSRVIHMIYKYLINLILFNCFNQGFKLRYNFISYFLCKQKKPTDPLMAWNWFACSTLER